VAPDAALALDSAVVATDAGTIPDAAIDAGRPTRDAGPKPDAKPPPVVEPAEPEEPEHAPFNETLKSAQAALENNNAQAAKQGANIVIDAGDPSRKPRATRRQLARAHAIRGAASCKTADLGEAKSDLGALARLRKANPALGQFRAWMLNHCHADQQLLDIK